VNGRSLSRRGLARLHDVVWVHVDRGEVPGLVALVARDDDVHVETLGAIREIERWPTAYAFNPRRGARRIRRRRPQRLAS